MRWINLWAGAVTLAATIAAGQGTLAQTWTATWGTAQPLTHPGPPPAIRPAPPGAPTMPRPTTPSPMVTYPKILDDQTVRMVVRTSIAGDQVRLEFRNVAGGETVTFDSVRVALALDGGATAPGSDRAVTFGGQTRLTLFAGARAVSDPVDMTLPALTRLAVSIHVVKPTPVNTVHALGLNDTYIAGGDQAQASSLTDAQTIRSYFWLSGVDVRASDPKAGAIVAFGDSITDGYATTPGAHAAWPDLLAQQLQSDARTARWSVVNAGISGNRVLRAGAGDAAVARFDADVLGRTGVKWVILLEGINDINMSIMPIMPDSEKVSAEQIIDGMSQLIDRAHARGVRIAGGTILPTKGLWFHNTEGERMRQRINDWIRTSGRFDAVIDFDRAVRDPKDPQRLRDQFNPGDHVHPNDAGNQAMAQAINRTIFEVCDVSASISRSAPCR